MNNIIEGFKSFEFGGLLDTLREVIRTITDMASESFSLNPENTYIFVLAAISFYIGKKFSKDDSFTFMLIIAAGVFYLLKYFG